MKSNKTILGIAIFLIVIFSNCSNEISSDENLKHNYPMLYSNAKRIQLENLKSPYSEQQIDSIEKSLNVPLPNSYKDFLKTCGGFSAFGGLVQMDSQHPFRHDFKSPDELTNEQKKVIKQKGGLWPPPSNGMICFAEFFMDADGDQVLFDVTNGLKNGEYPVMYYSHDSNPPQVRKIADSFDEWLTNLPKYFDKEE